MHQNPWYPRSKILSYSSWGAGGGIPPRGFVHYAMWTKWCKVYAHKIIEKVGERHNRNEKKGTKRIDMI